MANRQNWAEVTQWCLNKSSECMRIEKSNSALTTCRSENSGFALIIFLDNDAKCTVGSSKQNALPVWKYSRLKVRIRKIQKLRSDGKQLTESQNKWIQQISKVAHSSKQWTKFGVGKMLIRSIRSCSARRKVYGDKMQIVSLSTGVSIYIKLKFRHSSGINSI